MAWYELVELSNRRDLKIESVHVQYIFYSRQHFLFIQVNREYIIWMDNGANWTKACNVFRELATFDRMDTATFLDIIVWNLCGTCFIWVWCWTDGGTNCHLCWWNMVSVYSSVFAGTNAQKQIMSEYYYWFSEPSVRGIITAMAGISATLGLLIVFSLGSFFAWRNVSIICLIVPVVTMVAVLFVSSINNNQFIVERIHSIAYRSWDRTRFSLYSKIPETPIWLLSKNRDADALKSLQWLRGWVSEKAVETEFNEMKRYNEYSNSCNECVKFNVKCTHPPPTIGDKLRELLRKRTLKPFGILVIGGIVSNFSGIHHLMPYIVQLLYAFESPISANSATVIFQLV